MLTKWELTIPALSGDVPRRAYVYVPAAWEEDPSLRFPVLYMFDGHNLFFDQDATYGKSWGLLEYLEANRTPLIVAAVECNHGPNSARLVAQRGLSAREGEAVHGVALLGLQAGDRQALPYHPQPGQHLHRRELHGGAHEPVRGDGV